MSFFNDYGPDKSSDECYETLMNLKEEALRASNALATHDEALAALLSSLYIANQNQMTILWHMLAEIERQLSRQEKNFAFLEKKIDKLSIGVPRNRLK